MHQTQMILSSKSFHFPSLLQFSVYQAKLWFLLAFLHVLNQCYLLYQHAPSVISVYASVSSELVDGSSLCNQSILGALIRSNSWTCKAED